MDGRIVLFLCLLLSSLFFCRGGGGGRPDGSVADAMFTVLLMDPVVHPADEFPRTVTWSFFFITIG